MERDSEEDALRNTAHDAFMVFWRARDTADAEALWRAYCAAQQQYETYLMARPLVETWLRLTRSPNQVSTR